MIRQNVILDHHARFYVLFVLQTEIAMVHDFFHALRRKYHTLIYIYF